MPSNTALISKLRDIQRGDDDSKKISLLLLPSIHCRGSSTVSKVMTTQLLAEKLDVVKGIAANLRSTAATAFASTAGGGSSTHLLTPLQQHHRSNSSFSWMDVSFLDELRTMLNDMERLGTRHIASWSADGKSFMIRDPTLFATMILPKYLRMISYTTFKSVLLHTWRFSQRKDQTDDGVEIDMFTNRHFVRTRDGVKEAIRQPPPPPTASLFLSSISHHQKLVELHSICSNSEPTRTSIDDRDDDDEIITKSGMCVSSRQKHVTQNGCAAVLNTLRLVLDNAETYGIDCIISWLPHGKAFKIHNETKFVESVLPIFSSSSSSKRTQGGGGGGIIISNFKSFRRLLHGYGFKRVLVSGSSGGGDRGGSCPNKKTNEYLGAFYHPLFVKDNPSLCDNKSLHQMKKVAAAATAAVSNGGLLLES